MGEDPRPTSGAEVREMLEGAARSKRAQAGDSTANGHNAIVAIVAFYSESLREALARAEGAERELAALQAELARHEAG